MANQGGKPDDKKDPEEERIDHGGDESFPASDPPAVGGATRIDPKHSPKPGEGGASEDGGGSDDTPSEKSKSGTANPAGASESGLSGIAG
jgi:hypothetical protein